jgi:hypothetical protein
MRHATVLALNQKVHSADRICFGYLSTLIIRRWKDVVLIGRRFRLRTPTLSVVNSDRRPKTVMIPAGEIVKVATEPHDGMVRVAGMGWARVPGLWSIAAAQTQREKFALETAIGQYRKGLRTAIIDRYALNPMAYLKHVFEPDLKEEPKLSRSVLDRIHSWLIEKALMERQVIRPLILWTKNRGE